VVFFTPPTHEEPMRTDVRPLVYYRQTWANSIVRINGTLTSIRTPAFELLEAAGEHGVDYFIGGHEYEVTEAVAQELINEGFMEGDALMGYGISPYGEDGYGE
jgi:hypothetical protein